MRNPRRATLLTVILTANALCAAALALAGCGRYTSVGIDSDRRDGAIVRHAYYRVQWPGDGTFRLVWGENHAPPQTGERLMPFDLAGRFLLPPRREPLGNSFWHRIGFHYALRTWSSGDRDGRLAASGALPFLGVVSVPALLPPALALLLLTWQRYAVRRAVRNRSAA